MTPTAPPPPDDAPAQDPEPSGLTFARALPVFALTFVDVLGLTIILPLLHLYAVAFGASPAEILLTAAVFPLAQLVGVPVMGALSDRFGRKPLLIISQITTCISFLMLASANTLWMVMASRAFDGLFGANLATAQAALADLTDDDSRAQGLGVTGAAFGLGFLFGPAIAIGAFEFTESLALPAIIAAAYSFVSILLTVFTFKETLPPERRGKGRIAPSEAFGTFFRLLSSPFIGVLLVLMFAQQVFFYGFETVLGLFALNRTGLLAQGNGLIFLWAGIVLVIVQVRVIRPLSRRWGERGMALFALGMFALGFVMLALTPQQAQPFYIKSAVEREISALAPSGTELLIGDIGVPLPPERGRGLGGVLWLFLAVVPVSVGAGLIRPALNSLLTKRAGAGRFGATLGASAALVSAANAVAPLLMGALFQSYGPTAPFAVGAVGLAVLWVVAWRFVRPAPVPAES
ncbi:MAG: MFS transporter [Anaerolineae bacterium]|jgi:MFS family permease|nr:MFS transporter [Anaerolineae bacterium]